MSPEGMSQPVLLDMGKGRGYVLWDDNGDVTTRRRIPVTSWSPVSTVEGADPNETGWHAVLPVENGVQVDLTFDPDGDDPTEHVSMWLYVVHPLYGHAIAARLWKGEDGFTIRYSPECEGINCIDCNHDFGGWWEYVTTASQVMGNLAMLGAAKLQVPDAPAGPVS